MYNRLGPKPCAVALGAALFLLNALAQGASGRSAHKWLELMNEAVEHRNYIATFVYFNGSELQSMQVVHRHDGSRVQERIVSLSGPAREVLSNGREVTCIFPDDRSVLVSGDKKPMAARTRLFRMSADLNDNYSLSTNPGNRVAGRMTQKVEVRPRDVYRYGYRLSLDLETALPLRSELLGSSGKALERIVYTNIQYSGKIDDDQLRSTTLTEGFTWHRGAGETIQEGRHEPGWAVNWLPPGFTALERVKDPPTPSRHHLAYTDGVANFSVFVEPLGESEKGMVGISRMGATNAYGRVIGGTQITVIGEVPEKTVRHVGDSISRSQ